MTQDHHNSTTPPSAQTSSSVERVKAYRERLGSDFKRVEAYVTQDERERIRRVKEAQGATMDVAVAGLLRLGLELYESRLAERAAPASVTAVGLAPTVVGAANACEGMSAPLRAFSQCAVPSSSLSSVNHLATVQGTSVDSPISQFFRERKEFLNASSLQQPTD